MHSHHPWCSLSFVSVAHKAGRYVRRVFPRSSQPLSKALLRSGNRGNQTLFLFSRFMSYRDVFPVSKHSNTGLTVSLPCGSANAFCSGSGCHPYSGCKRHPCLQTAHPVPSDTMPPRIGLKEQPLEIPLSISLNCPPNSTQRCMIWCR